MKEIKIRLVDFLAKAKKTTRGGFNYKVTNFQKDGNGNIINLKGTIKGEDGKDVEVFWNIAGTALTQAQLIYDIVEEDLLENLIAEVDTIKKEDETKVA